MEGPGRKSNSVTHSILPALLLTQVWLQWCVTLVQRGCSGPPGVPRGALSQMRWQVWRQSSSTLHSQAQKPTTNTIKTPSPTSRLGSLLWFAWLLSSARDMKSAVSGDRVTGQASLYHGKCIFTSARQMLAFMHPSLRRSQPHHSTSLLLHTTFRLPTPGEATCHPCSSLT